MKTFVAVGILTLTIGTAAANATEVLQAPTISEAPLLRSPGRGEVCLSERDDRTPTLSVMPATVSSASVKNFSIDAHQFAFGVTPSPFVVNQGDTVTLTVTATDVSHGFVMDRYFTTRQNIPAGTSLTVGPFVADLAGTFTYSCTVFCGSGHGSMGGIFTVNVATVAAPVISSFSPTSGPTTGGTAVTLNGSNFQSGATVLFGSSSSPSVTFVGSTGLTAIAPAQAAGTVTIKVTNPDGQSGSLSGYTYISGAPAIGSFSPTSGPTTGGTSVTVSGSNFQSGATVRFGSVAASSVVFNGATSLTAVAPSQPAGIVSVTVTNPDGQSASLSGYLYVSGAPLISAFSPASGSTAGGNSVIITGSNFQTGAIVAFGSSVASSVIFNSSTSLTATAPPHAAGSVSITVTNPDTQSTSLPGYTYVDSTGTLSITSVTPASGTIRGGTIVSISGSGLTASSTVSLTFGGIEAMNLVLIDATTLRATTPAHAAGLVDLVLRVGSSSASLQNGFTFTSRRKRPVRR